MESKTLVEVSSHGVAIITINNPPLNLLSVDVVLSLEKSVKETVSRDDVKVIVIIGSKGKFSAGFDVTAFGGSQPKRTKKELGHFSIDFLTETLEAARKPFVAAIDGPAFGGGLEIALACHARIATPNAQLGLTELQYGILPGFGGTQRLPRLVGLSKALEMILMSKRVNGVEAQKLSLVDAIAPSNELLSTACKWALEISESRKPWLISLHKTDKLEPLNKAREIFKSARLKQNPNLFHPFVCIDVIEHGIVSGPRNGLWKEAEALQELRQSSTCKSLVHFFFAQRQMLKVDGISGKHLRPRKISKVAVLGEGFTSSEMAVMLILNNYQVILKEDDEKCLLEKISRVKKSLQIHSQRGKLSPENIDNAFSLLKGVPNYDSFKDVDLVIEAKPGNGSLKQPIFADLEKHCPLHCIFVGNTLSSGLIEEFPKCQNQTARINFFCPSPKLPLVEIVRTKNTSPQVIVDLIDFARKMKKTSVIVKNCAINRVFVIYLHAAMLLTERGVDVYQIDHAITSFGIALGPFRMIDHIGLQVAAEISGAFAKNFPDRSYKSALISVMQHDHREGESNGKGFYIYDNFGARPDSEIMKYVRTARIKNNIAICSKLTELSETELVEMILFPAVNEACRLISEAIPFRISDLDMASVMGMGFPNYRGGIVFWSDSLGPGYVCTKLENWSKEHGDFYRPCTYLIKQASKGISLGNGMQQCKARL